MPSPSNPNPDGACIGHCDCGAVPCGEYLWDWRNGSQLTDWIIKSHIGGPNGLDNPAISGFFVDDFWCSDIVNGTGSCGDPVQGPTEVEAHSQVDMGLSDQDVADITNAWLAGFTAVQQAILDRGAYTWSLIPGQDNANAEPLIVNKDNCLRLMQRACSATDTPYRDAPLLHGVNFDANGNLTTLDADIAAFLLMRGPWAWTGAGYGISCDASSLRVPALTHSHLLLSHSPSFSSRYWGMSWPTGRTWNSSNVPVSRPPQFDVDYGEPLDANCLPSAADANVFVRRFSHHTAQLNCTDYTALV